MHRIFFHDDESPVANSGGKVLIIDDEPRLCDSLRMLLDFQGFDHHVCTQGAEAISVLDQERFDVILLDIGLPDMSGHEVLKKIREQGVLTPVIIVSGESSIDAAIRALRNGAYDFVRKPYEPEQLLQTVKNAIYKIQLEKTNRSIQEQLVQSKDLYRHLVNDSPDLIYILDKDGNFSFVNHRFEELLGYENAQLIGHHYSLIVHEDDLDNVTFVLNERNAAINKDNTVELRLKSKKGESRFRHFENKTTPFSIQVQTSPAPANTLSGLYGVARDISDRKKAEDFITHQTYHDALTNLPNRFLFKDRLEVAIAQAKHSGGKLAVMLLDLDRFKMINDTLGHILGDELLVSVAHRLKKSLEPGDTLARVGGDEFNILIPQIESLEIVAQRAKTILANLEQPFVLDGQEFFMSASIGIAAYPEHGDHHEVLSKSADIAMYHVKSEGKNGYMAYHPAMNEVIHRKLSLENELRRGIETGQLVLNFQPQVNVYSRSIFGMESLVRWMHPQRGLISPAEFIPLAEETGLITRITEWVLEATCQQFRKWREMGISGVRMSINFSPQDIERDDIVSMVRHRLDLHGIDSAMLEIEITEGTIMRDMVNSTNKLKQLGSHGIKIAIDDFGTGYSSLAYLKQFPVHTIKIDKAFVHDIKMSPHNISIVSGISLIAKGFGLDLITEGVETHEQMEALSKLGHPEMQGFLFSRPLNQEEATYVLLNQEKVFSQLPPVHAMI